MGPSNVQCEPKKEIPMRSFSNELEKTITVLHEEISSLSDRVTPCLTPESEIKPGVGEQVPVNQKFSQLEIWLRERIAGVQDAIRKIRELKERVSL